MLKLGIEISYAAVIKNIVVGGGNRAAFFEVFDFTNVALADGLGVEGAFGAFGDTLVTKGFRGNNGNESKAAGEFVLEDFVFGPRIDAVEDDAFLTGGDEVFGLGDGLTNYPVGAFGLADHFAEEFLAFAIGSTFDTALLHFFVNHSAKIDFGDAAIGEVIDSDGFATAAHADEGDNFNIFCICHMILLYI